MREPALEPEPRLAPMRIASALCLHALLASAAASAGTPAATTQRWATIIEPRASNCGGLTSIADPLDVEFMSIRSDRSGNLFVSTSSGGPGVLSFTTDGRKRWEFATCPQEAIGGFTQGWMGALPDERGGAWVQERRSHWLFDMHWERLHHIDSHGTLTTTIDPGALVGTYTSVGAGIVGGHLRLTWTDARSPEEPDLLRSVELAADGTIVARRDIMRGDERVVFGRTIGHLDGEERMFGIEEVLLSPRTYGDAVVLSRVTAANVAEHIVTLRGPWVQFATLPDGTPWITQYEQPRTLTHLDLDGTTTTVAITPVLSSAYDLAQIARPHDGRFLLVGEGRFALIGSDGVVQRDIATVGHIPAAYASQTPFGWFLPVADGAQGETAAIYSYDNLELRARFGVDLPVFGGTTPASSAVRDIGPDGSLVTLDQRRDPDDVVRTRIVGFSVPGSNADLRLLRDDFEP